MYKCKQIIDLCSDSMDKSLPLLTRMEMKLHFFMCKTCRQYSKHLQFLNKALGSLAEQANTEGCQLSEAAKQRIAKKMQQVQQEEK